MDSENEEPKDQEGLEQSPKEDLSKSENNPKSSFGYNPIVTQGTALTLPKTLISKKNGKKVLFGGGIVGGVLALLIVGFLSLIPLKIEDIVRNLENHFYSVANNDASSEVDKIFRNYFEKYVGPAMMKGECSSSGGHFIISRDCNFMIPSTGKNKTWRL